MILDVFARGTRRHVDISSVERAGDALHITVDGSTATVRLDPLAGSEWWQIHIDGAAVPVRLRRRTADGRDAAVLVTVGPSRVPIEIRRWLPVQSRRTEAQGADHRIEVRAPMPGLVTATPVAPGDRVAVGSPVVVVEAMKMQMEVPAPASGRIEELRVRPGQEVAGGQVLVVVRAAAALDVGEAER
ncbi:MAG: acetyl-CoA carboxylase biotin carboxyl carrier protein subunit [bacterium]